MPPLFDRIGSLPLYALEGGSPPGRWAGFWPGPDAALGPGVTLEKAWKDAAGIYLFVGIEPADFAAFAAALAALRPNLPADVRFLWIADPHAPPGAWRLQLLRASGSAVSREAILGADAYGVWIGAGAALAPSDPDALGHGFALPFTFLGPDGAWTAREGTSWLPLEGPHAGSFLATLVIPDGAEDGMARLGVALRYALPATADPADEEVTVVAMPVLRQRGTAVTLRLAFDPLDLLDPARSHLAFAAGTAALDASFVTTLGYRTTLTPLAAPPAPLGAARLVFCRYPRFVTVGADDAGFGVYLAPDGAFSLTVLAPAAGEAEPGPMANRLTLGTSGIEYAALGTGSGAIALFQGGRPAYAPNAREGGAAATGTTLLTELGTTAWLTLLPAPPPPPPPEPPAEPPPPAPKQLTYYAQPPRAPFSRGDVDLPPGVLAVLELPAALVPPATFPAAGYRGIDPALADAARLLESAAVAPARRALMETLPIGPAVEGDAFAVTPAGLVAEVITTDGPRLLHVVIGNLPKMADPTLEFPIQGAAFMKAIQSNEVFFVAANADVFEADSPAVSVKADLDGWVFDVEPAGWRRRDVPATHDSPTIMIFKFCMRSLQDMVADTAAWGWPAAAAWANEEPGATQAVIRALFDDAAAAEPGTPYRAFYDRVVANRAWNGVLVLNAPVGLDDLPDALQFVAAGIDPVKFYAHHVGFPLTPFDVAEGVVTLGQTAVFGLIDYRDPGHLSLTDVPFAFKTLRLTARFANASLVDFSAQVELLMNVLFSDRLTKEQPEFGNNLVLNGSLQTQNGQPAYAFTLQGQNRYRLADSALESVDVLSVQLQGSVSADQTVTGNFVLGGDLRFTELPDFDLFSYGTQLYTPAGKKPVDGRLRFGGLLVQMSFPLTTPSAQTYVAYEGERMGFDLAGSTARPRSLANGFPLQLSGCVAVEGGQTPEALGYTSVVAPLDQSPLSPPWYGLTFTIDLGTLGALAGGTGLSLTLLAAWAPGGGVYLGLRLPTGDPLNAVLPVQGVVKLGFRSFQFTAGTANDATLTRTYLLRMRRFGISFFGLSFPPGNADIFLFGGRDATGKMKMAWYGAYVADSVASTAGGPNVPPPPPPPPPPGDPGEVPPPPPKVLAVAEGGTGVVVSAAARREARSLLSGRRGTFLERQP